MSKMAQTLAGKYTLETVIGEGGQGVVHRARAEATGRVVAIKTLRRSDPDALLRLKGEYRTVADLEHPRLVRFIDLLVDGEEACLVMDLVEGVDLVTYVRGPLAGQGCALDSGGIERLSATLPQVVEGLEVLHASGRLHRDIKPSNVLVSPAGDVTLLDFGFSLDRRAGPSEEDVILGTLAYMAPDLAWGEAPSAAGDWYAVGAMVYEALTGSVPFEGNTLATLLRKRREPAPSPRARCVEVPESLDALVVRLMAPASSERGDGASVMAALRHDSTSTAGLNSTLTPSVSSVWEAPFVGRGDALATLRAAAGRARGAQTIVHVSGRSGMGKSALMQHFLEELAATSATRVFRGRCHLYESVPFNAIDGVVDQLCRHLAGRPSEALGALLPPDFAALSRVFPVMAHLRPRQDELALLADVEPQTIRRRAFAALRALLCALGEERPLVVWLDDVQWADQDSAALLESLTSGDGPPRWLLALTFRAEDEATSPFLVKQAAPEVRVSLGPLNRAELGRIAASIVGTSTLDPQVEGLLDAAEGSPFLACELVRHYTTLGTRTTLDLVVDERVGALTPGARRLLEVVAAAGGPCPTEVVAEAAGLAMDFDALARSLRAACLVRPAGRRDAPRVETYHDRIREAVLLGLPAESRRQTHLALAHAFERQPAVDANTLLLHYLGAGEKVAAAGAARRAARQAFDVLAFDHAAALYQQALDLQPERPDRWTLLRDRAEALRQAGRGADAGQAFEAAAREVPNDDTGRREARRLERMAAEQFLRAGHLDDGLRHLRATLSAVGEGFPGSGTRALLALVWHRARLALRGLKFSPRRESDLPERTLARLDACWAAAVGLVWVDPIISADFHGRHTRLALDAGEPLRVVRALCTEAAYYAATGGGRARRQAAAALEAARRVGGEITDPVSLGLTEVCAAGYHYFSGEFTPGFERAQFAADHLRARCTGVAWELTNSHIFGMWSLAHTADIPALTRHVPTILDESRERGDLLATASQRAGLPSTFLTIAADHPDVVAVVEAECAQALAAWTPQGLHLPHVYARVSRVWARLFAGRPNDALALLDAGAEERRRMRLLDFQIIRAEYYQLRARAALLGALDRPALRAIAADAVRRLNREDAPWLTPYRLALGGGLAALDGDTRGAQGGLRAAAQAFEAAGHSVLAAACALQAAPQSAEADAARERLVASGVRAPDKFAAVVCPRPGRPALTAAT